MQQSFYVNEITLYNRTGDEMNNILSNIKNIIARV